MDVRPDVAACFREWQRASPTLAGGVQLELHFFAGQAAPADVHVSQSELGHTFLEGCVANAVRDLRVVPMAADASEVTVTYPFILGERSGAGAFPTYSDHAGDTYTEGVHIDFGTDTLTL